jgi:hypothetical protein
MVDALSALRRRCPSGRRIDVNPAHPQPNVNHPDLRFGKHGALALPKHWVFMPRVRTQIPSSLRAVTFGLLLASACGLAMALPADGQEAGGLRGAMRPEGNAGAQQPGQQPGQPPNPGQDAQQAPVYVPASEGAVPDDPAVVNADGTTSLFGQPQEQRGAFTEDLPIPRARPPSTARDRKAAASRTSEPAERATAQEPVGRDGQDDTTTGTIRTEAIGPAERISVPEGAGRLEAIEDLDPLKPDDNPFAPLGIRVGTFVLRPSIEQGITTTSNADYSVDGQEAVLSETTLRLNAISDWTRHFATLDAYATFRETLSGYEISETRAGGVAALDLDINEELRGRATLTYERAPETAASPVVIEGTVEDPIRQTFGGSLGLEKDVGKARFGITGRVERDVYGEADLSDGTTLSQDDRNATLATLTLRGGYEISPALTPFVEVEGGHRFYDEDVDSSGFRRSSDRFGARGGVEVNLSEKLNGELSAGWIREKFEDNRLTPIEGPTLNALLTWEPERATRVDLSGSTTVEGTTTAGESGSLLHSGKIIVERQVRSNLTASAEVGASYRDYSGSDDHDILFNAQLGATWWLNRYAGLTGRLRHESQTSTIEGRGYEANSVFLGVKLQR